MNAIEHLEQNKWEHPDYYAGHEPEGYVIAAQHRDSDVLDQSNYERILEDLLALNDEYQGENDEPFVYDFRAGHWAVGWVEYIIVTENAPDEIKNAAGEILCALADYPVYDEMHYSEKEWEYCTEVWNNCYDLEERVELCSKYGVSIFAARHDYIPSDDFGHIYDTLRG